jgi:YD repeat-containing protein
MGNDIPTLYTYDTGNRQVSVDKGDVNIQTATYNSAGQRISKETTAADPEIVSMIGSCNFLRGFAIDGFSLESYACPRKEPCRCSLNLCVFSA